MTSSINTPSTTRVTFGRAGNGFPVHILKSKRPGHEGEWGISLCGKYQGYLDNLGGNASCTECCQIEHAQKNGKVK